MKSSSRSSVVPCFTIDSKGSRPNKGTGYNAEKFNVYTSVTKGDHKSPNPLKYTKAETLCPTAELQDTRPTYGKLHQSGALPGGSFGSQIPSCPGPAIAIGDFTSAYNEAVSQLNAGGYSNDGNGIRGSVDLTIDGFQLGLLRDTIGRIARPVNTLARSIARVGNKRGKADVLAMTLRELGSYYLEWWYGIRPTLMTGYELAAKLHQKLEDSSCTLVYKSRAQRKGYSTSQEAFGIQIYPTVPGYWRTDEETSYRVSIKVNLAARQSQLQELAGYVSLNPLSWAWELKPMSFVVDWFWNFGAYLRDLETCLVYANRFVSGSCTYTAKRVSITRTPHSLPSAIRLDAFSPGRTVFKYCERKVLTGLPVPRIPRFDPRLGERRLFAAAALLSQALGHGGRTPVVGSVLRYTD